MKKTLIRTPYMFIAAVMVLIAVCVMTGDAAYASSSSWPSFRGNDYNNGIVSFPTPIEQSLTSPVWCRKFSSPASGMSGWDYAPNTPIIVDGDIITTSAKKILRIDPESGVTKKSGNMSYAVNWGNTPLTYAEMEDRTGVIFCPLAGGHIEAFDSDALNNGPLWTFSMATVSMKVGADGVYSYFNNRLLVTDKLAERYFPELRPHESKGVSFTDALVAAHIDKYGPDAVYDNLQMTYDSSQKKVVVTKQFGIEGDVQYYKRDKVVGSDLSAYTLQNGNDLLVRVNSEQALGYFNKSEVLTGFDKNKQTATLKCTLKCIDGSKVKVPDNVVFRRFDPITGEYQEMSGVTYNSTTGETVFTLERGVYYVSASGTFADAEEAKPFSDAMIKIMVYKDDADRCTYEYDSASAAHQSLSPIVYSDGIIYTGFYKGYDQHDYYVAIDAITGDLIWSMLSPGGFYWNGGVATKKSIIVGTQDGVNNNDVTGSSGKASADSRIISLDKKTGEVISEWVLSGDNDKDNEGAGDVCSSIVYDKEDTGRIYWTTCGGYICSAKVDYETGEIIPEETDSDGNLRIKQGRMARKTKNPMSVSTPVVYKGRVYFGYKEKGANGCFAGYDADSLTEIFKVNLERYSKSSPLITTAYEKSTEYLYAYLADYDRPGGITVVKFGSKATDDGDVKASQLFAANGYSQYGAASVIADRYGQMYYRNDSNTIFAMVKSPKLDLGTVTGFKVTPTSKKFTIKYSKKKNATKYRILYRLNETGAYKRVDTTKTSYVKKISKPTVITVKVRPEHVDAAKTVYGKYTTLKTVYAAKSKIKKLTSGKEYFTVKFDKHKIADGYQIQYATSKKKLKTGTIVSKKGAKKVKYKIKLSTSTSSSYSSSYNRYSSSYNNGYSSYNNGYSSYNSSYSSTNRNQKPKYKKKTYYVRVRSYKIVGGTKKKGKWVGGTTLYGTWSKVKKIKVKVRQ